MDFNNWKYLNDQGGKIIPETEIPLPDYFVKYYALSKYSVDALRNGYLYFSHPLSLNDPFDSCRQMISLDKFSRRQFVKLFCNNNQKGLPNSHFTSEELEKIINDEYENNKEYLVDRSLTQFWNLIFKDWGILSLSDAELDNQMWAYYCNHSGFLIKYHTNIFDSNNVMGPFPINYTHAYKTIHPRSIKIEIENLLYATNVKAITWKHEKEWRYLVNSPNMSIPGYSSAILDPNKRKINYDISRIDSIFLGYKFFLNNIAPKQIGNGKRLFIFDPTTDEMNKQGYDDFLKLEILNFAVKNQICLKEVQITENNLFKMTATESVVTCQEENKEYILEEK